MNAAVIVVDLLKDVLSERHAYPIAAPARAVIPKVNELTAQGRERGWPVVFACDSFLPDDFLFRGKMKPHCLRGTTGAEPIDELDRAPEDVVLPKRRFSAFFKTDLDQSLRTWGVDTVLVTGISTHVCVLTTALDAVSHDFRAIIVEDATAAYRPEMHRAVLELYRRGPLEPLLEVRPSDEIYALAGQG